MSIDAMALVRISTDKIIAAGEAEQQDNGTWNVKTAEGTFVAQALDDATLLHTGLSMREAEPNEIVLALSMLLGDKLAAHDDDRGIFLFPNAASPKATTYDAVIEEVGDLGDWTKPPETGGGFDALAGDLMDQLGPDVMDLQRRMAAGDPSALQDAMAQVSKMLADPSKQKALADAVAGLAGEGGPMAGIPGMPPNMPNPMEMLEGMDLGALQQQAQQMLADNPNLENELLSRFQGDAPPAAADEGKGEGEGEGKGEGSDDGS